MMMDDPTNLIAGRVRAEREARGWPLAELAKRSNVSKAMISKIERGECSPTASLLGRLSGAFGLTLTTLLSRAEEQGRRLSRRKDQAVWRDPGSRYLRRSLIPASNLPLDLTEISLPAGAAVDFPRETYLFVRHVIWVIEGELTFTEGEIVHRLQSGDSLILGPPEPCRYANETSLPCRYLVILLMR
jgi:transcriptional regulator with XRE-family HTH domain